MGQFTVTYPTAWKPQIIAGLRGALAEKAVGLTDAQVAQAWLIHCLKDLVIPIALREAVEPVILIANAAIAEKEAAAAAAYKARLDVEAAAKAELNSAFGV